MKLTFKTILCSTMALTLAACSSSSTSTATSSASTGSDTFRFAIGGEANYPDPAIDGDTLTASLLQLIGTTLYTIDGTGSAVPEAAESYDVSEDGLTYTFHLRDDLKWSDGQALTAADFEYGIKRTLTFSVADAGFNIYVSQYLANGDKYDESNSVADMTDLGVKAVDETTLEFTLAQPCSYFVALTAMGVYMPAREDVAPEGDYTYADNPDNPVSGPYKITSIDRASEITFEKNEYYFDADNMPTQYITYTVITDTSAQLLAFQNDEIDFASSLDTSVINQYDGQDELVIPGGIVNYYIQLYGTEGSTNKALEDVDIRKAITEAVDREALCTALDAGELYVPLYGFVPKGLPDAEEGSDFRTVGGDLFVEDVEDAKSIMESKGYSEDNMLTLEYYYNDSTIHSTVAQVLQQQLAEIYIDVELKTGEIRTFFDDRTNGNFEMARNAYSADYMDVSNYMNLWTKKNQDLRTAGDEHYDELCEQAEQTTDVEERYKLYHEAEEYFISGMYYQVPLFQYGSFYLAKSNVSGIVYTPAGGTDLTYVKVS